jgi:DNA-binding CsgD family transcriptional regulator
VQTVPRGLAPVPRVVLATREVDRRTHHRSAAYGEFYSAFDLEHLACIWLTHVPYGAPGMTGLLLTRPQRASDFDADDRRLLSRALPALSAATSRCRRFGALELQRAALDAIVAASTRRPCLVLSALGDLVWASPAATRLLSGTPCAAPDALRMAARRLCATTRSEPAPTTVRLQHHGASIVAELSMLRAEPPLVLVDIEGLAASSRAHDLARRFQLTAAEARVLEQLVAGLSNASIGAELGVSIETVRTHVRRILAKLGVESRVQAALLAARHIGG